MSINIWKDKWIKNGEIFSSPPGPENTLSNKVHDMFVEGGREWNESKLQGLFSPAVCSIITSIPISWTGSRDKLVWSHKASDIYLVSFGYQFAFDLIKNRGHPKPKSQTFSLDGWPKGK